MKGLNQKLLDHTCWKQRSSDQTSSHQAGLHLAETGQTNAADRINALNKTIKGQKIIRIEAPQRGVTVNMSQ